MDKKTITIILTLVLCVSCLLIFTTNETPIKILSSITIGICAISFWLLSKKGHHNA